MTHKLLQYVAQIEKTHKGLGRLFSFSLMNIKAKKVTIIIAVAGSGKTTALEAASKVNKHSHISFDSITRSGLKSLEKKLTDFEGTVIIGDLGNIDTGYSTKESIKTAVMLTYEHHLNKLNAMMNVNIENFQGSFITSAQPVIMQNLINSPDWEAVIRDKTTRYYHFNRPVTPNSNPINVNASWGLELDAVTYKEIKCDELTELYKVGLSQWGRSRANIHIKDMLRACAALDNRKIVNKSDISCCLELTKPMLAENFLIDKAGFESQKEFLGNHACMLTEFATYDKVTHDIIATDFFVSIRQVERLLTTVKELYIPNPREHNHCMMTDLCYRVLKECGYK